MNTHEFFASLDHLHEMLSLIRKAAKNLGFLSFQIYQIELSAEEAIVNVIHHSYQDQGGKIFISIAALDPKLLQITIQDEGIAFNPLIHKAKVDRAAKIEERETGGLGVHLMRKCMDDVAYQRKDNKNILILTKKR